MKKTILCALFGLFGLCFQSDAMNHTYTVCTNPPVNVAQSNGRVCLDGLMTAQTINLGSKSYNGITLHKPLCLRAQMTEAEMISALKSSFGNVNVNVE